MPSSIRIQLCGPIAVEVGGERVDSEIPGRQGRLLFALLVLNRHRVMPRSEVVDVLWTPGGPDDAEAALSVLLSRLRRALPMGRLDGRGTVRLVLENAWVDFEAAEEAIHRAESAVARGDWSRAWAASQGAMFTARRGFLSGEEAGWVVDVRRRLDAMHLRALEAYGRASLALGGTELPAAREAGRRLVELAPLRESGHRLLMRTYLAEGNQAQALAVYESLRRLLLEELGVAPSAATQGLFKQLLG